MRRAVQLLFAVLLLSTLGAGITVEQPASRTHLDAAVSVQVSDASGPVQYSLNGGTNHSCDCIGESIPIIAPDGTNTLTVYDSNGDTASRQFTVDTEAPNVSARHPRGTVYTRSPSLSLRYRDTSRIDTDNVHVTVDSNHVNGTASQRWFNASLDRLAEGNHTIRFTVPDEHWQTATLHNASGAWNISLPVAPVLSGSAPAGVTGSDVTLEVSAADPSPIDTGNSYITLRGPEERRINWSDRLDAVTQTGNGAAFSTQLTGLDDGVYTVTAHVEDANGNAAEHEWNFTVDTTAPALSVTSHLNGDVVAGTETVDVNVSDLTQVDVVNVTLGNQTATATAETGTYSATVDTTSLVDGETTLSVTAVDAAGNTGEGSVDLVVDNTAPEITGLEIYPDTAQDGIILTATARDAATQIIGARYRIEGADDTTVASGRMLPVNGEFDAGTEPVEAVIQPLNLTTGNYTAFLMTRDAAGHTFDGFGTGFTVDNTLNASLQIQKTTFRQEIGTTRTVSVPVTNTGAIDERVTPSVETGLDARITPTERRIEAGETKQFELEIMLPDDSSAVGNHSITLAAAGLSTTARQTGEVIGQPHPAERQQITASLQELKQELAELNQSRQDWELSSDTAAQLDAAAEQVRSVEQLLEQGRYRAAQEKLAAAENTFDETQNSVTGEITRARLGAAAAAAAKLLAVIALAALLYGCYRLIPAEEGYHPDRGYVHRPDNKHPLRLQVEDWWRRMQSDEPETRESRREKTVDRWKGYGS